jgi:putative oxidoreductase
MAADPRCTLPACNACFRRSLTAGPVLASFFQRLLVGEASVYCEISFLADAPRFAVAVAELLAAAAGALIIVGLWTPATGIIVAAVQGWIAFSRPSTLAPSVLAALALSLAMVGPGAWSIDARLFGRKQINTNV